MGFFKLLSKRLHFFQVVNSCGFRLEKQTPRLLHGSVQGCGNSMEGVLSDGPNLRHTVLSVFYRQALCCFFLSVLDLILK